MKVARSALPVTLAHWERAGVRETVMAGATYIVRGGAAAMAVSDNGYSISQQLHSCQALFAEEIPEGELAAQGMDRG